MAIYRGNRAYRADFVLLRVYRVSRVCWVYRGKRVYRAYRV